MAKKFIVIACACLCFSQAFATEENSLTNSQVSETSAPQAAGDVNATAPTPEMFEGVITKIYEDGAVELEGKKRHLMGVLVPWRWWWGPARDCYSIESGTFLENELLGKHVTYSFDPNHPKNRHGRKRVYIFLDGRDINAEIISRGFGFADRSRKYVQKERYIAFDDNARSHSFGLWHTCPVECYEHNACKARNW